MASLELLMTMAVGITRKRTLMLVKEMHGREVVVLIDGRATHNFVATALVNQLRIPTRCEGSI